MGPGTELAALLAEPFVETASEVTVRGPFEATAAYLVTDESARQALLKKLKAHPGARAGTGTLELMWIHTPPFGRLFLVVDFEDGVVKAVRTSSLD